MTTDPLFLFDAHGARSAPHRLVPERIYASGGVKPGVLSTLRLEDVRDKIRTLAEQQQPEDVEASFSQLHVAFEDGRVYGRFLAPHITGERMLLHERAYRDMAQELLPSCGGAYLLGQSAHDVAGEMISTLSWSQFSRKDVKPRLFRTVLTEDPSTGATVRMIRSWHSDRYAPYDNLCYAEELLQHAPGLADLPVFQYHASDSAMRLRVALEPEATVNLQTPTPMLELWNSETGRRRVSIQGGIFKLVCTNGMVSWSDVTRWAWRHYGSTSWIRADMGRAVKETTRVAQAARADYDAALAIVLDDAWGWLAQQLRHASAPRAFIERACSALLDPTTTAGGSLASAIDAVTLAAQATGSLAEQATYEAVAARMLHDGLAVARNGRITVGD